MTAKEKENAMTEQALVRAEPEVTTMIQVIERAASNVAVGEVLDRIVRLTRGRD